MALYCEGTVMQMKPWVICTFVKTSSYGFCVCTKSLSQIPNNVNLVLLRVNKYVSDSDLCPVAVQM